MKLIKGIYLPGSDTHFEYHLEKGPEFHGKGTYQFKKVKSALDIVIASRDHGHMALAVDVGAHVGLWSRVLGHHFLDTYAFEPVDEYRDCLVKNVNDCPHRVHPQRLAVASYVGAVVMKVVPDNTGNSHVRPLNHGGVMNTPDTPVVPTTTLDGFGFTKRVNFLKLDVEGFELDVLKGAGRILTEDKPIIVLEQKPGNAERYGWKQRDALAHLHSLGYQTQWEMSGDFCVKHSTTT